MFIFTRIIIKLGAAPFHSWFLSLSKTLSLLFVIFYNSLLLLNLIKILALSRINNLLWFLTRII